MGVFSKVKEATVTKTGQYFKPGMFKIKIGECKAVEAAVGNKTYFVVETEVLESNNSEIEVGGERSQVIDLSNVMGMPNVKHFVAAASGVEPTSEAVNELVEQEWKQRLATMGIDEETDFEGICELIVSEANPLEGQIMDLECVERETKTSREARQQNAEKQPQFFTKHIWQPIG